MFTVVNATPIRRPLGLSFCALSVHRRLRNAGSTLISFIWSPGNPLPAGTGGSENYTVGQVRELTRRGIRAQVVTVGLGDR